LAASARGSDASGVLDPIKYVGPAIKRGVRKAPTTGMAEGSNVVSDLANKKR